MNVEFWCSSTLDTQAKQITACALTVNANQRDLE